MIKLITPEDWTRAFWIGRAPTQETLKYQADHGIPAFRGRSRMHYNAPPSYFHSGYAIQLADCLRLNNPMRHVYQAVRLERNGDPVLMIMLQGRFLRLAPGQWTNILLAALWEADNQREVA